ncbi:MAG TPA: hypothetical protein VNL95_05035 [Dehalococcoidia bacterium]|nr:hypothetical protein [Dehalococcoidia bacterium]
MALMVLASFVRAALGPLFSRLHLDQRGQDTAEYLVMTGVVVAIIATLVFTAYSGALDGLIDRLGSFIDGVDFNPTD